MKKHIPLRVIVLFVALLLGVSGKTNLFSQNTFQGAFSVSETTQVYFSPGNLQYIGSAETPYWKFADHQWDYFGSSTGQNSSNQNVDRDLFGWGTSGYNHGANCYQPWSTSETYSDYHVYGIVSSNLFDQTGQADWGYNAILNGGNQENSGWRTLTHEEWNYVFNTRSTSSGIRYAKANVNNINGVILLPDDWSAEYYTLNSTNTGGASYSSNVITAGQWNALDQHGAVFLPAAGYRVGSSLNSGNNYYWSASYLDYYHAWEVKFGDSNFTTDDNGRRFDGFSVRLVRSAQIYSININATPSPESVGSVSGSGSYEVGTECTLTATASAGYIFANWTENGVIVSTDATYSFVVWRERNLVANFASTASFSVADGLYVYFSPGNLQYIGSASTPYWKFADNQWDCLGTSTGQNGNNQNVDRDLFGWGTSGYNHGANCYQPWSTSRTNSDYYAYGSYAYNLFDQTGQADWGYNAILNGGNQENSGWRTLTHEEWAFVFNTRNTASGIRYAKAKVNNVNGVVLLPDNWSVEYYTLNSTNTSGASYSTNVITAEQWGVLGQHGAVFLPAAGYRDGTSVYRTGSDGNYWSSSCGSSNYTLDVYFNDSNLNVGVSNVRYDGQSVRLVFPSRGYSVSVDASPSPAEGGSVSGAGNYEVGAECTLTATASAGYIFANWTENGVIVSTDATYSFVVWHELNLVANFASTASFSVADGLYVYFSPGNLQYIGSASTPYWKFADNQWDCLGTSTGQNGNNQNVDRDLFGWGTSGYNHGANCYQPWSTSRTNSDYYAYGSYAYNLFDQTGQADWGYNAILNGGNQENSGWRTLTHEEWAFVFNTRNTASGIRYAKAKVNNVNGVILLPDDWSAEYYTLNSTNTSGASYSTNVITAEQWGVLGQHGAVFLPAAGYRDGTSVYRTGSDGNYWSSSYGSSNYTLDVYFNDSNLNVGVSNVRYDGQSVRLVRSFPAESFGINATPNPTAAGTVAGAGEYMNCSHCTLTATAAEGWTFVNWTENGEVVSTEVDYTFIVTGDRDLVANFIFETTVITDGALSGVFSVGEGLQVNFSQGNLQYIGSSGNGDENNTGAYWKFAEHQWDYFGGYNGQGSDSPTANRDLFGWGTSGYNHGANCYQPWSTTRTNSDYYAYGSYAYNLFDQTGQADWGYNAILNGGNQENSGWRTLTHEEWAYVFNTRSTASGIRYAKANVNNVNGVILLPDDWSAEYYTLNSTNTSGASYSTNVITAEQWGALDHHGAVFLPTAGYRDGTSVYCAGSDGNYWSSSYGSSNYTLDVYFNDSNLNIGVSNVRYDGQSVRLVRSFPSESYGINATPNPAESGTVTGAGEYMNGAHCALTATPNEGWNFINWTENGEEVSTEAEYGFTVTGDRELVANFEPSTQSQTLSLAAGANYVSFNVETTLVDLQTALTDALGTTGVTMSIKSQTEYTELKRGKWTTGFNNFNVAEMFIINVSAACEITLTGAPINPAEHPVTMVHGANWIAYPLSLPMTITNVFTGFVGTNDALTSQTQYSKYIRGKWSTEIELQPGQGYIYESAASGDRPFTFPNGSQRR